MDELDRRVLAELQDNFPVAPNPYRMIADKLGIGEAELWNRVCKLVETGVIRRIGFSLDSGKLGYASTLAALRVPQERIEQAAQLCMKYTQITHCYLRDDAFNVWFTVIAEDEQQIGAILEEIRTDLDLSRDDTMNLPVKKLFKLDARFK